MFQNIGKKIKIVAIVIMIVGIVLSVVGGLFAFWNGYLGYDFITSIVIFVIITSLGILGSWLSVFILYGFGELVDQTMETNQRLEEILAHMKRKDQGYYDQPRRAETRPSPVPSKPTPPPPPTAPPAEPRKKSGERKDTDKDGFRDVDSAQLPLRSNPPQGDVKPESHDADTDSDGDTLYIPKA